MALTKQEIAEQVNRRAAELLPEDVREPLDDKFVLACLGANERGDGCMFASLLKDQYLYNTTPNDGEWYSWMNHVWQIDDFRNSFQSVELCALEYLRMVDPLQKEIDDNGIDKKHPDAWKIALRDKYKKRVDRLRSEMGVKKTLTWAPVVDQSMACREPDFNKKHWLLPVKNGVIDLKTGALTSGRPADLMTRMLDIEYDPHADYSLWHKTLVEISGSEEIADFLKRSFGYAITGHAYEQYIWVFIGPGRNGKGIIFNLIGNIMAPFYHEINQGMLLEQRNAPSPSAASEHKYSLLGKRIIVGAETNKGQKIDASAIKQLTGEDKVLCRPNFGSEISFDPTHTMFLHTNHIPYGLTSDFAMTERLLLVEFPHRYVDDIEVAKKKYPGHADQFRQKDPHLKDKLRECRPGILRWLVEGCLDWQERGLDPPAKILDGVTSLQQDEDYIGQFIQDCLIHYPDDTEMKIQCTTMYMTFKWWWSENMDARELRIPAMKTVNKALRERGFIVDKHGGKTWIFSMIISLEIAADVEAYANKSG